MTMAGYIVLGIIALGVAVLWAVVFFQKHHKPPHQTR